MTQTEKLPARQTFLRHSVATLAYRAAKVIISAPAAFGDTRAAASTRSAVEIVAHMADLMEWAVRAADNQFESRAHALGSWDAEVSRFFAAVALLDERLGQGSLRCSAEQLFQGPIADALTHVGQLATLRRLSGTGVRGESYFRADVQVGRVGLQQSAPIAEWD